MVQKRKWSKEEESALRAGVVKYGTGKWCAILLDKELGGILKLRSNVDLKDKWRNMGSSAKGCGSQDKARVTLKKISDASKHDDNPMAVSTEVFDDEIIDAKPLAVSNGPLQSTVPNKSVSKLDNCILEAIRNLKAPSGSNKTAIATYIKDQYMLPRDFKRLLSIKLKTLTASGKLIKVNHKYRIAPSSASSGGTSKGLVLEEKQLEPSRLDRDDFKPLTNSQVNADLARLRYMTPQEAAAAAAQTVAQAEAATAEAEEAAREAEALEDEAEAAQAFADAAKLMLKNRNAAHLMVRV